MNQRSSYRLINNQAAKKDGTTRVASKLAGKQLRMNQSSRISVDGIMNIAQMVDLQFVEPPSSMPDTNKKQSTS